MSEQELVKRYVTKYALTEGIFTRIGTYSWDDFVNSKRNDISYFCGNKAHLHTTWPEALAKAESMRAKKIASLRAQIAKLESLVFVKPEGDGE